jgi:hypothetical protein
MRMIFIFAILLFLIPFSSSISTNILPAYQPGETMILEIQGNILEPISHSDIIFKRSHVAVAVDYDIKKIQDKYYLYAQVPLNLNNYTLFINNIATIVNGKSELVDYNSSFEVAGNLTDYSINPGFIVAKEDFTININSNLDQQTTINSDFPDEHAITLNPGTNILKFSISNIPQGFYTAKIGKYILPIQIIKSPNNNSQLSLTVVPKIIRETIKKNSNKSYNISIINSNSETIENIYFIFDKNIFSMSNESITLGPNISKIVSITLKQSSQPISSTILIAKDNNILGNISFQIIFTNNESEITNSSKPEYYCSELGGKFCSASEICSMQTIQSLDGTCCVGSCNVQKTSSSNWIVYTLSIVVLIIIIFFYMRYKKTKITEKNLPINSILKKK